MLTQADIDHQQWVCEEYKSRVRDFETRLKRLGQQIDDKTQLAVEISSLEEIKAHCESVGIKWKYGMTVLDMVKLASRMQSTYWKAISPRKQDY